MISTTPNYPSMQGYNPGMQQINSPQAFKGGSGYGDPSMDFFQNFNNNLMSNQGKDYANVITQGTDQAKQLLDTGAEAQQHQAESGGQYGMPGMSEALSQRAQKNFSQQQAELQNRANFQGQMMNNQNIQTVTSNILGMQNAQRGIDSKFNDLAIQQNAARFQTVSNLMNGAGSIGGFGLAMYQNSGSGNAQDSGSGLMPGSESWGTNENFDTYGTNTTQDFQYIG